MMTTPEATNGAGRGHDEHEFCDARLGCIIDPDMDRLRPIPATVPTEDDLVAEVKAARREIAQARAERLLADDHITTAFARLNRAELALQRARYER